MDVLVTQMGTPSNWTPFFGEKEEIELERSSTEYNNIFMKLTGEPRFGLQNIYRIQNPYLYNRYLLKKAEYEARDIPVLEHTLFHATAACKVSSIITNNLDWRLVSRYKFGRGVSFSNCTQYANRECAKTNGSFRAIIIAKVLFGYGYHGTPYTKLPPKLYDTTTGRGKVYVKYYDDEFYPEYVAYYHL